MCRRLHLWTGGAYGDLDPAEISARGLTLVTQDTDLGALGARGGGSAGMVDPAINLKEISKESWEVSLFFLQLFFF